MNIEECEQAIPALERWFQSQDMTPADAGIVMLMLQAKLLTENSQDISTLQDAVIANRDCLTIEIANILRKNREAP